jgi:23S rRNA (cytidine1920-2'-O)/16S rRNA (cytidine1409-2'-O)-methyltransferase
MMVSEGTLRLDLALVARGLAPTRSRARDLIVRGLVQVRGQVEVKPATMVPSDAPVAVTGDDAFKVSRGGLKLEAALAAFEFEPAGLVCLDIGASTGGFTEVLLARGAAKVFAVDVGHGQLHTSLRDDPRVVSLEAQDSRTLDLALVPDVIECIVADVSFISLSKALPAALRLAAPRAWLVALVKPQFEVGRDGIGKGGIVRDADLRNRAYDDVVAWVKTQGGWLVRDKIVSPILGGSGNEEFLLGAVLHT